MYNQACAILLASVVSHLDGLTDTPWDDVYSGHGPPDVVTTGKPWLVCRIVANMNANIVAVRQSVGITVNVQAIGPNSAACEEAADRVFKALQRRGYHDRHGALPIIPTEGLLATDWKILSFEWMRDIRVDPHLERNYNLETAIRFYERGHQFEVLMSSDVEYA